MSDAYDKITELLKKRENIYLASDLAYRKYQFLLAETHVIDSEIREIAQTLPQDELKAFRKLPLTRRSL